MAGFSSVLKITDLDDFINPSQDCIKPLEKSAPPPPSQSGSGSRIKIELEDANVKDELRMEKAQTLKKVEVSLQDCLACSGCITSAESVLISQQSPDELFRVLGANKNTTKGIAVVTLGVQAVLSLAHKLEMCPQETAERLAGLFKELGADYTTTITVAENLALIESTNEFINRYNSNNLPVFSGICPGWVCYSEKVHPHVLSKISHVKSPQQIMGSLLKLVYGRKAKLTPDEIYHVTLMSCFDRKLEASRPDFSIAEYQSKEVDVVITAVELEQILTSLNKVLLDFNREPLVDFFSDSIEPEPGSSLFSHYGSGSGGYAEYVLRNSMKSLFGKPVSEVTWKVGRNPDIHEAAVQGDGTHGCLKFSIATGFRNIQTLVRKLKTKTSIPHYIEIMACPSGCMNGGAQVRPTSEDAESSSSSSRELATKLEKSYHENLPEVKDMTSAENIYQDLQKDEKLFQSTLYTEFHAVAQTNFGIKW